jgi:acyl-CoA thioester hydrolase
MKEFNYPLQIRWSDLDPNFHLRHSVYYDWGAYCRIQFLDTHGLTADVMKELNIGPIIFREEGVFKKEIRLGDEVTIDLSLTKSRRDFSRFTFRHRIMKRELLAAILTLDVAWLNTVERKLAIPPQQVCTVIDAIPKDENFEWSDK